jgi:hypothetical protein
MKYLRGPQHNRSRSTAVVPLSDQNYRTSHNDSIFSITKMLHYMNRSLLFIPLICCIISIAGCSGGGPAIVPTTELTEEQKAAIKAADAAVDDEESQGKNPANKKKK